MPRLGEQVNVRLGTFDYSPEKISSFNFKMVTRVAFQKIWKPLLLNCNYCLTKSGIFEFSILLSN